MKEFSNKTPYLAPQLTVVEFKVERGYELSEGQQLEVQQKSEWMGIALMNEGQYVNQDGTLNNGTNGFETFGGGDSYFGGGSGQWF